jgi:hypothetical protein
MAPAMSERGAARVEFPRLRWIFLAWMAVWLPAYWVTWTPWNFLLLCNISMFFAFAGVWRASALLLSSQAVATIFVGAVWAADVGWRAATGGHLIGGTEYMFDAANPLWVRLLSFYHLALPAVLVWMLGRTGYDPRGWRLQAAIAAPVFLVTRLAGPWLPQDTNPNYVLRDPILGMELGPAPMHLLVLWLVLVSAIYWPTHKLLERFLPQHAAPDVPRSKP